MRAAVDSYSVTAKYYDGAYAAKQDLVDLPFYLDLAEQTVGPILEIACGTGRVLLPIARKGIEIHGVDNSRPMLKILRIVWPANRTRFARESRFTKATCATSAWAHNTLW